MKNIVDFLTENELSIAVLTAVITFYLGRYTSRLDDHRTGLKDINEKFYRVLISLYISTHHAYALYFVDLPLAVQDKIMRVLLENEKRVPPWIEVKILELDQCFSGYSIQIKRNEKISDGDKRYVEELFQSIYEYVEKQYQKNERKLYHTMRERIGYRFYEIKSRF